MHQDTKQTQVFPFNLDQIKNIEYETVLGAKIKNLHFDEIIEQHNSTIGKITLDLKDPSGVEYQSKKFFKKPKIRPERSDNAILSHENEAWVLEKLSEVKGLEDYVPELEFRYTDRSSGDMFIIMELLKGQSKQESLGELFTNIQKEENFTKKYLLEKARVMQVRNNIIDIANFNGLVRDHFCSSDANNRSRQELIDYLGKPKDAYRVRNIKQKDRLLKHLLRIIHFDNFGGLQGKKFESNPEHKDTHLNQVMKKFKIDLLQDLNEYIDLKYSALSLNKYKGTRSRIRLQQGDCRIQHIFDKTFCDYEDFGSWEWYHDIATFTCSDLSKLPIEEIPLTVSLYLIAESIRGDESRKVTKKELRELLKETSNLERIKKTTGQDLIRLINKIGLETTDANDLTLGYVAGVIENRIITNGAKKKSSSEELKLFYPYHDMPRYQLYQTDLNEISELFNALTEGVLVIPLDYCSSPRKARNMFYRLGSILQKTELIDIPNLNNLRKERSGYSFFITPPPNQNEKIKSK
ncbi:hypothetical protein HN385_00705 [archaeon]|jgi:hypothetical protein|nr:hypothetical protein [archaeon]MBT3450931.1 hypothetical protein [archaeon]MBT6869577.1 hypothetical protein [archaeon]MBT7193431.1 hypothetical protein [archaeon]MBT7381022.1 hypothetical protein [archaeon]